MPTLQLVTDSHATFAPWDAPSLSGVTIVPNRLIAGGKSYREGVDLSADEALALVGQHETEGIVIEAPSSADFAEVYRQLARTCNGILSIHPSRELSASFRHAQIAAANFGGSCKVVVLDSETIGVAQGVVARGARGLIMQGATLDTLVRDTRREISRIYSIYYTETLEALVRHELIPASHGILSGMLQFKPILTIEHGRLHAMEKVRTRAQAVERMVEFAMEFSDYQYATVVAAPGSTHEVLPMLQARLEETLAISPLTPYGASLAAYIGTDAVGLVIMDSHLPLEAVASDDDDDE